MLDDEGQSKGRIISINGTASKEIYNRMINTNEIEEAGEVRISPQFAALLSVRTNIRPPYKVVAATNNHVDTILLNGVSYTQVKRLPSGFNNQIRLGFRMYPEKSMAIMDYNTCNFGRDSISQWRLNHWLEVHFKQLADHKIKTLFIDISRNGGGILATTTCCSNT